MAAENGLIGPTFGYSPVVDDLDVALRRGRFTRALVIGEPITRLFDEVAQCKVISGGEQNSLPEGVYWFEGLDEPLVLQVGLGNGPQSASVAELETLDDNHALSNAWGWAEDFWETATPVPPPQFSANEPALTIRSGQDVLIRSRKFLGGHWTYTVLVQGRTEQIVERNLLPLPDLDAPESWVVGEVSPVDRFAATLTRAKLRGHFANTLYSFRATRTTFRPYQFKPVLKLLQTGKARILIADEVGLGKTIEAGLVWTELEARHSADRVLVVCPSGLLGKWVEEMEERFGIELTELDAAALDQYLERFRGGRLPKRYAYVCSLERLRTWKGLEELEDTPPEFDLVIIDEAHAMRNASTKSYKLGVQLSEWAESMVFLTATPINLRQEDLLHLLELLAPEDYDDIEGLELRLAPNAVLNKVASKLSLPRPRSRDLLGELARIGETPYGVVLQSRPDFAVLRELFDRGDPDPAAVVEARRLISDLNTLATIITRTKKSEVDEKKAIREPVYADVVWSDEERTFYEEFVAWCKARALELGQPTYFVMQMPLRLASACLPMARQLVLDPIRHSAIKDEDSKATDSLRVPPHPDLVAAARAMEDGADSKFDRLLPALTDLQRDGRRALLFTFSRPTLTYLEKRLRDRFRVAVMHGGVSRQERRRIMAAFRHGEYDFVLANRVASEGLDFEFCSAVINYDLPWNPMEIEQRIGRIDRIGQTEEKLLVLNFYNEETIDERIMRRILERIGIFEASIGSLEPIINSEMQNLRAAFDFTLTPQQQDAKLAQVLTAIETQRAGLREVADASASLFVSDDVDIAGLEEELVRTGRYVGQNELAHLLEDWAATDGGTGVKWSPDGQSVEFIGNIEMAQRLLELARQGQRNRFEIRDLVANLQAELPIPLSLDQELARSTGAMLLAATNPLVMAATAVPGHRQARFTTARIVAPNVQGGVYLVVLGQAKLAARGGDEIWGAAVRRDGRTIEPTVADALLAALARGEIRPGPSIQDVKELPRLAKRAQDSLTARHHSELELRERDAVATREGRRIQLTEQHQRRLRTIERRISTAVERGRKESALSLFRGQRKRAQERHAALMSELDADQTTEMRLEYLAACLVEVSTSDG